MNKDVSVNYGPDRNDYNKILVNTIDEKMLEVQKIFNELKNSIKKMTERDEK